MRFLSASVCLVAMASGALLAQNPKKKDDPSQIGSRDVGKGINIYSIELVFLNDINRTFGKKFS